MRYVILMSAVVLAVIMTTGCSKGMSPSESASSSSPVLLSGVVQAGLVSGAIVTVYALNSDGSQGAELAHSAPTDSTGGYALNISHNGPVLIVASGGTYQEEVAVLGAPPVANTGLSTVLSSVTSGQTVAVTPVTSIAAQACAPCTSANIDAANIHVAAAISAAMAAQGIVLTASDILTPPAAPAAAGTGSAAAKYALALTAISQMADTQGVGHNSLTVAAALSADLSGSAFATNGGALATATATTASSAEKTPSASNPVFANWAGSGSNHLTWNFSAGTVVDQQFQAKLTVLSGAAANVGDVCSMTVTLNSDNTAVISGSTSISGDDANNYCNVWNKFDGATMDNQGQLWTIYWSNTLPDPNANPAVAGQFSFAGKDYTY